MKWSLLCRGRLGSVLLPLGCLGMVEVKQLPRLFWRPLMLCCIRNLPLPLPLPLSFLPLLLLSPMLGGGCGQGCIWARPRARLPQRHQSPFVGCVRCCDSVPLIHLCMSRTVCAFLLFLFGGWRGCHTQPLLCSSTSPHTTSSHALTSDTSPDPTRTHARTHARTHKHILSLLLQVFFVACVGRIWEQLGQIELSFLQAGLIVGVCAVVVRVVPLPLRDFPLLGLFVELAGWFCLVLWVVHFWLGLSLLLFPLRAVDADKCCCEDSQAVSPLSSFFSFLVLWLASSQATNANHGIFSTALGSLRLHDKAHHHHYCHHCAAPSITGATMYVRQGLCEQGAAGREACLGCVCFAPSASLTTTACVGVVAWKQLRSWKETAGRMTLT